MTSFLTRVLDSIGITNAAHRAAKADVATFQGQVLPFMTEGDAIARVVQATVQVDPLLLSSRGGPRMSQRLAEIAGYLEVLQVPYAFDVLTAGSRQAMQHAIGTYVRASRDLAAAVDAAVAGDLRTFDSKWDTSMAAYHRVVREMDSINI